MFADLSPVPWMSIAGNRVPGFAGLGIEGSGQFEPTEELDWLDRERLCPQEIITEDWDAKKGKDNTGNEQAMAVHGIETVNDNEDRLWSCTENGKLRWRTQSNERYIHIFCPGTCQSQTKDKFKNKQLTKQEKSTKIWHGQIDRHQDTKQIYTRK